MDRLEDAGKDGVQALNGSCSCQADQDQQTTMALPKGDITAHLENFFLLALDLFCITDLSGRLLHLNHQWQDTLGYPLDQLRGTCCWAYVHPEDQQETLAQIKVLEEGEAVYHFVNRYRCQDGSYRWLEWRSLPFNSPEGTLIYAAARDVTKQRVAELALQRSEARYRNIVNSCLEGIWLLDMAGNTTFANQRMAEMLGYPLAEFLATPLLNFFEPEDQAEITQYIQRRQQGLADHHTVRMRRQDGTYCWAMASCTPQDDGTGSNQEIVSLLTDITPLIEAQEALSLSKLLLSGVLDSSLDGIMAFRSVRDDQGKIVDFEWLLSNPAACAMVGHTAEELIGQRLLGLMPGHGVDGLFDHYVQVVETGQTQRKEFYYHHEKVESWFENIAVKLGDGFTVTFRDVTQTKMVERSLHQLNQQLEERVADLDRRHQEMLLLSEMSDFLQACLSVEEACQALPGLVAPLFPHEDGALYLLAPSHDVMERVAHWGEAKILVKDFSPRSCWALRRGRSHPWRGKQQGLKCDHVPNDLGEDSHTLCVPLMAQGETLGLLHWVARDRHCLTPAKQQLARTVAEQIALAISNLQLRETLQHQSIRDPLTGLFNRRYLEEALGLEINRAHRKGHGVGVIMIDVDHFKRFNDTYGHEAGDWVLERVGALLREQVRGSDIACRYGGEELLLVLPESSLETTQYRAEELRQKIAALTLHHRSQQMETITASLGVAAFPHHGSTATALIQAADAALYRAKAAGRNRVIVAP